MEQNWKKLLKMNIEIIAPNLLRVYVKFLLDVAHD